MNAGRRAWLLLAVAAVVVCGSSCSRREDAKRQVTVCFAFQDLETEFWVAAHKAITETRRAKGIQVIEHNAHQDANRQLEQIRAAIARGVDLIFTSSDFMYPQVRAVLELLGKWKKIGEPGHVILGGVDGDLRAARWMKEGYVDATGVQDLFYEADALMNALLEAMDGGQKTPEKWMDDPGFALTQGNVAERANDMWGFKLLALVLGQMFVLILGGIDLSQTSIMALTSVIGAMLMTTKLDPDLFAKSPLWGLLLELRGYSREQFSVTHPEGAVGKKIAEGK